MTKNKLNWDIGWLGGVPTDSAKHAVSRQNFFVECMWCDRYNTNHTVKCKSKQDLVELYTAYRERIDLSGMGFSIKDSDLEAIAGRTWDDKSFQEAIGSI
jgi:hypothetical protein